MTRDVGFDDFLDAVEAGDPQYLVDNDGRTHLPPMPYDPATGEKGLTERPVPEPGEILTHTTTQIATPQFEDDTPYVTAVASFGPVDITGQLRDISPENVEIGQAVTLGVERSETRDERVLVFYPA
ncbi:MAG: putative nucleic-acid-binding protein containing a Zn-ribbon [halophilic archaeon J07HX64]|jgi:Predicted nucleic-acid-binding protein containing a Zn-ribbon|nr:MAG: putative nucleic-acid-binding protein containing a Zn-ribbon [halophilic archaeon J07HX64]